MSRVHGYSHGFEWTGDAEKSLISILSTGCSTYQASKKMSEQYGKKITYASVHSYMSQHGIRVSATPLAENYDIPVFNGDLKLLMDDYIITADYHSPYYSILWHNRSLAIAERFGIKKLVVIGDLVDFGFASFFYADHKPGIADESDENKRLIQSMLAQFDEIVVVKGNHEDRLGRNTNGIIQARYLFELWSGPAWKTRFLYSLYDKLTIGGEWLCVHPKSYSQKAGIASRQLASIHLKNIINTHGHHVGWNYDPSGKFLAVDLGGMFDVDKIEYLNIKSTTHPRWNSGFGMFRNGYFHLFDERTDWDFWLKEGT